MTLVFLFLVIHMIIHIYAKETGWFNTQTISAAGLSTFAVSYPRIAIGCPSKSKVYIYKKPTGLNDWVLETSFGSGLAFGKIVGINSQFVAVVSKDINVDGYEGTIYIYNIQNNFALNYTISYSPYTFNAVGFTNLYLSNSNNLVVGFSTNFNGNFQGAAMVYTFKSGAWTSIESYTQGGSKEQYTGSAVFAIDNTVMIGSGGASGAQGSMVLQTCTKSSCSNTLKAYAVSSPYGQSLATNNIIALVGGYANNAFSLYYSSNFGKTWTSSAYTFMVNVFQGSGSTSPSIFINRNNYAVFSASVGSGIFVYKMTSNSAQSVYKLGNPVPGSAFGAQSVIDDNNFIYTIDTTNGKLLVYKNLTVNNPSSQPSRQPSRQPTSNPTHPTSQPSLQPSRQPSAQPSIQPYSKPSSQPSRQPATYPTQLPTAQPTVQPSRLPTAQPSRQPTSYPSRQPSVQPSNRPSCQPSLQPSGCPTRQPSLQPSHRPTEQPSMLPSERPSQQPSSKPSNLPSQQPSLQPSQLPTSQPTVQPFRLPTTQPSKLPTTQPSRQPSCHPSGNPTSMPSNPSSKPSRQPTSQPTSYPVHEYEYIYTVDTQSTMTYSSSISIYSASYTFTNLGMIDKYYLQVKLAGTSFSSSPLSFQVRTGPSNTLIGTCSVQFLNCDVNSDGVVTGYNYLCLINEDVTSYIYSVKGGSLSVTTTVSNFSSPCKKNFVVSAQYLLENGHRFPTPQPTRKLSNNTIVINSNYKVINIGAPRTALPIILGYALVYGLFGILLVYIRRSDKIVTQHSYFYVVIDLLLLASQQISEFMLIFVMIDFDDGITFKALAGILLFVRLSNFIPATFIKCKLADTFLVDDHMAANAKIYAMLGFFCFFCVPMMRYMPWKESEFTKVGEGMPSLIIYNIITWFSFANSCFSTVFQVSFLVYANRNASLTSSIATVYASVILSIVLLVVFLYESFIFKRRLKNFNIIKDKVNKDSDLESRDSYRGQIDRGTSSGIDMTVFNPVSSSLRTTFSTHSPPTPPPPPIDLTALNNLVSIIKETYGYSSEMSSAETIFRAAIELNVSDECEKLVGLLNKAVFIADMLKKPATGAKFSGSADNIEALVSKIKSNYGYDSEKSSMEVIYRAAIELKVFDECEKIVGVLEKAKFICSILDKLSGRAKVYPSDTKVQADYDDEDGDDDNDDNNMNNDGNVDNNDGRQIFGESGWHEPSTREGRVVKMHNYGQGMNSAVRPNGGPSIEKSEEIGRFGAGGGSPSATFEENGSIP